MCFIYFCILIYRIVASNLCKKTTVIYLHSSFYISILEDLIHISAERKTII